MREPSAPLKRGADAICAYRCHCGKREQHSKSEPHARLWIATLMPGNAGPRFSPERRLSKRRISAVDHEAIRGVVG